MAFLWDPTLESKESIHCPESRRRVFLEGNYMFFHCHCQSTCGQKLEVSCITYLQKHNNLQANICCCTRLWGKISPWLSNTKACTRVTRAVGVSCDCGGWSDGRCSGRDDFPDSLWAAFERWDVGSRWEAVWLPIHIRLKATAWLLHSSMLHNVTILMIWFNETLINQIISKKSSNTN